MFGIGIKILSPFNTKAKAFVTGRKGIFKKLEDSLKQHSDPLIWVHCASLGEFEQGRPVIEALKAEYKDHKILLTFFSPSGYQVRKGYPNADYVFYLPLDTAHNASRFVGKIKPSLAIFIKYEFWFHFSEVLRRNHTPLISISSIFRKDQIFFRVTGNFFRRILKNFSHFFVQNQESVRLLQSIDINNCTQSGDTRFDRVKQIEQSKEENDIARKFKAQQKVFIIGSCWQEDLDVLVPFINENKLKFIVAPHEITDSLLDNLKRSLSVKWILYSQAEGKNLEDFSVLIIDNVGMLSKLYRYGEFAYIGGAFGKGLHNILEASCYGIPILFGNKNYHKFKEAVDLVNRGGAFEISGYGELKQKYEMLKNPEVFLLAGEACRQYVEENVGATETIMKYCRGVLKNQV